MNWLIKLIQNIGCEHDYIFERNIYGDEINNCGGYRSIYKCCKCGKQIYKHELNEDYMIEDIKTQYDKYYDNKYNDWCKTNKETLYQIISTLYKNALNGISYGDIVINCDGEKNDYNYYTKWLIEHNLNYNVECLTKNSLANILQYNFHIFFK